MLNDSNTVCIDMRNHYESEIGFFKGAIKPNVDTFLDSLEIIDNELKITSSSSTSEFQSSAYIFV